MNEETQVLTPTEEDIPRSHQQLSTDTYKPSLIGRMANRVRTSVAHKIAMLSVVFTVGGAAMSCDTDYHNKDGKPAVGDSVNPGSPDAVSGDGGPDPDPLKTSVAKLGLTLEGSDYLTPPEAFSWSEAGDSKPQIVELNGKKGVLFVRNGAFYLAMSDGDEVANAANPTLVEGLDGFTGNAVDAVVIDGQLYFQIQGETFKLGDISESGGVATVSNIQEVSNPSMTIEQGLSQAPAGGDDIYYKVGNWVMKYNKQTGLAEIVTFDNDPCQDIPHVDSDGGTAIGAKNEAGVCDAKKSQGVDSVSAMTEFFEGASANIPELDEMDIRHLRTIDEASGKQVYVCVVDGVIGHGREVECGDGYCDPIDEDGTSCATDCAECGNDITEPGEECDGTDMNGETCENNGFVGGDIACDQDCNVETSGCNNCGNGTIDTGEKCDGTNMNGETCENNGFVGGDITCTTSCELDTSDCNFCGNGTINPGEQCDGANPGTNTCENNGFIGGDIACDENCNVDTSGCHNCGDGNCGAGENETNCPTDCQQPDPDPDADAGGDTGQLDVVEPTDVGPVDTGQDTEQPDTEPVEDVAEPDAGGEDTAQPDTNPGDTEQPDTEPVEDVAEPDAGGEDTAQPDTNPGDTYQPDTADTYQADTADTYQPDTADTYQPDTIQPDAYKPDTSQTDTSQADTAAIQDTPVAEVVEGTDLNGWINPGEAEPMVLVNPNYLGGGGCNACEISSDGDNPNNTRSTTWGQIVTALGAAAAWAGLRRRKKRQESASK